MELTQQSAEHPAGISRRGVRRSRLVTLASLALAAALAACTAQDAAEWTAGERDPQREETTSASTAASAGAGRQPVYVDSILPVEVLLDRFRADIPQVDSLSNASGSREALVRRFVNALAVSDSADLIAMAMSPAEFAWLYYPESEFTRPPYELGAEHVYMLIDQNSRKGLTRMLRRSVGVGLEYAGHDCEPDPRVRENDRLWEGCTVRLRNQNGSVDTLRLFGAIWERDGRWKLVSYANEL